MPATIKKTTAAKPKVEFSATVEGSALHIIVPIDKKVSSSGKSLLVASTGGFKQTMAEVDGKQIRVNVTAIVEK